MTYYYILIPVKINVPPVLVMWFQNMCNGISMYFHFKHYQSISVCDSMAVILGIKT